ncbi:MAG: proton-conducting transporter membrane subunit [Gemmataceae bacterium]
MPSFAEHPGHLFVVATLLPLGSFLAIWLASAGWCLARPHREQPLGKVFYRLFGGDKPGLLPALLSLSAILISFVLSLIGAIRYQHAELVHRQSQEQLLAEIEGLRAQARSEPAPEKKERLGEEITGREDGLVELDRIWDDVRNKEWKGQLLSLVQLRPSALRDPSNGTGLSLGFSVDGLTCILFVVVSLVTLLILVYSMSYLSGEERPQVEDAQVHGEPGHFHRRGRYGRFFMYLSLFAFSMLHLILADNLFQVFLSWQLLGLCSFLLIGFYHERSSAIWAAGKAFLFDRVGDVGLLVGMAILFGYLGTFHFESMFKRLRSPSRDTHGAMELGGKIVRASVADREVKGGRELEVTLPGKAAPGSEVVLFPRSLGGHFHGVGPRLERKDETGPKEEEEGHESSMTVNARVNPRARDFSSMPFWMLTAAGLAIFLGCIGKSALFPLHVWLPDTTEGPTPVSAMIQAVTMVPAGVYLVGRCFPLFTFDALLFIAYTGVITLFLAATMAMVMTDMRKVLAYATISQVGFMMLALGLGGWSAGMLHLVTHVFFLSLLILGSGSVIRACQQEQDMTRMGGLYPRMKVTAWTMLAGSLALAGAPLFSGWYSRNDILSQALGYAYVHPRHLLLFVVPLFTTGLTAFYVFRLWLMTFTGSARNSHVTDNARESPWLMTMPLIILAVLSVGIAWGWPLWKPGSSLLAHHLHDLEPVAVRADFGSVAGPGESWPEVAGKDGSINERSWAQALGVPASLLALLLSAVGLIFAPRIHHAASVDPSRGMAEYPGVDSLLREKWYLDQLYQSAVVQPTLATARGLRGLDAKGLEGPIEALGKGTVRGAREIGRFDQGVVTNLANLPGRVIWGLSGGIQRFHTGSVRSHLLFLMLGAVAGFSVLSYFLALAGAG